MVRRGLSRPFAPGVADFLSGGLPRTVSCLCQLHVSSKRGCPAGPRHNWLLTAVVVVHFAVEQSK